MSIGGLAASVGAYVAAGIPIVALQAKLFAGDQWDQHQKDGTLLPWLWGRSMSSSGVAGTLDPVLQVIDNLKYQNDINGLFEGAAIKWVGQNGIDILRGLPVALGMQDDESNTKVHNMMRGLYNVAVSPALSYMATRLGGFGFIPRLGVVPALQYLTSQGMGEKVATKITGPSGTSLKPQAPQGLQPLPHLSGLQHLGKLGEAPTDEGAAPGAAGEQPIAPGAGGLPWGMLDDFMVPAAKMMATPLRMIPGWALATAGVGAAAYEAHRIWSSMAPYRAAGAAR
jgi:hypothetical protein